MHRVGITAFSLTAIAFVGLSLLQSNITHGARLRTINTPQRPAILAYAGSNQTIDLNGEWRVRCAEKTYKNGTLISTQDSDESLIVAETDKDGSYQLYKFPKGFGEAFPRLRKIASNQYAGQDTVKGITTLVKQNVDIENEKITIRQTTIDAPSNKSELEVSCSGVRIQSTLSLAKSSIETAACKTDPSNNERPDPKLAARYKAIRSFSDGLAAVAQVPRGESNLKWGFIDKSGRVVVPLIYDVVTSFHDGLAVVGKSYGRGRNLKWGVVEKLGPQVTPNVHYDAVKILGEGFAAVGYARGDRSGLRWNLINRENTTIQYGFDDFGCFVNGRARASYTAGGVVRKGFINKVGDFVPDEM
jgi:hypothetical protein